MRRILIAIAAVAIFASCGDDEPTNMTTPAEQLAIDQEIIEDYVATLGVDSLLTTESGLTYFFDQVGQGAIPQAGQNVTVHYVGTFLNGEVFDSSRERNQPFSFPLGAGRVISGWDQGVALLPVGSIATLVLPSSLAYGPFGAGPIGPNEVLVFEVEVLSAQ